MESRDSHLQLTFPEHLLPSRPEVCSETKKRKISSPCPTLFTSFPSGDRQVAVSFQCRVLLWKEARGLGEYRGGMEETTGATGRGQARGMGTELAPKEGLSSQLEKEGKGHPRASSMRKSKSCLGSC